MAQQTMTEAARSVMGQFFPGTYRNTFAAGEMANAPVTALTVTDRYQNTTSANGSIYSTQFQISPLLRNHFIYALSWGAGVIATAGNADSNAYPSISANGYRYRCSGMEVVVESTVASQNIQGEWAAYCYPGVNTIVGGNQGSMTAPSAARGFFTDAKPSMRYVLFKMDEADDDWRLMSDVGGVNNETCILIDIQTAAAALLTIYVTTTWTVEPNPVGQLVIPGEPVLIDQAAYQRGIQTFGDAINENIAIITDPIVAKSAHPGILARVADAVATTVREAWQLKRALAGAATLGDRKSVV